MERSQGQTNNQMQRKQNSFGVKYEKRMNIAKSPIGFKSMKKEFLGFEYRPEVNMRGAYDKFLNFLRMGI